jgi:serine protease Do
LTHPTRPDARFIAKVVTFSAADDLATIYTPANFRPTPSFLSGATARPVVGDKVFAIGSAAGNAGTITRGEIANLNSREVLSTAQAAPGSSGGALFNDKGQLVGLVRGARGTLLIAVPITRFCSVLDWIPATSCKWKE